MQGAFSLQQATWLLSRSDELALITDFSGIIEYVNPAFENITGYPSGFAIGFSPSILKSGRHTRDFYENFWRTLRGGHEFHGVLINRRRSGELYYEEKTIRPLVDHDGCITHFLSCGRDVSERVGTMEKLAHQALHDSLTELPNRTLFQDRMGQALSRARRSGEAFAVAMVDLDSFKSVNDLHGHLAGDVVLRAAAVRLRSSVREVDTVARLGGDEFGILLPGVADSSAARLVLHKMVEAFAAALHLDDGSQIALTISVGAALYPGDGQDNSALLGAADRAMYGAKYAGGNAFRIGGPSRRGPGCVDR